MTTTATVLQRVLTGQSLSATDLADLHGYGGLHGGVLAALLVQRMQRSAGPDRTPVEITAYLTAPTRGVPDIRCELVRVGKGSTIVAAHASVDDTVVATATAVFSGRSGDTAHATIIPAMPTDVVPVTEAHRLDMPVGALPILDHLEIRPATGTLPFSGSDRAELCAWIRIRGPAPDRAPSLLVLMDALAPSYTALLRQPLHLPTVRMTVRLSPTALTGPLGWCLVQARTREAAGDGWLSETIDMWADDGRHLATATQLRALR